MEQYLVTFEQQSRVIKASQFIVDGGALRFFNLDKSGVEYNALCIGPRYWHEVRMLQPGDQGYIPEEVDTADMGGPTTTEKD